MIKELIIKYINNTMDSVIKDSTFNDVFEVLENYDTIKKSNKSTTTSRYRQKTL